MRFVHESWPQRVCFGSGESAGTLAREVSALRATRVMVIAARPESELAARVTAGVPAAAGAILPAGLADDGVSDEGSG
jgi:hypothetical protein